jgi:hypothetical protein
LAVTGGDIMDLLGLRQGREVGCILNEILERVIINPSENEKNILSKIAVELWGKNVE